MIAYSYLRFSTTEQIKGDSFRRQLEASEKYAAEHGLTLDKSLKLHDLGLSAFDKTNVTKGQLGGFLKAVEQGRVHPGSYLLVESLDRLSRAQVLDALQQFIAILNADITIVTLSDNQTYSKESVGSNFAQLIISITIMSRAHEESVNKSRLIGKAWQNKLDDALKTGKLITKNVPGWMKVVDGKIELIPDRADTVRRIFELFKEGMGSNTIAKILNGEGRPSWNKQPGWQVEYVHIVSRNKATYGALEVKGQERENYYPAVITKTEFEYLQMMRESRFSKVRKGTKSGNRVTNLFSGIAFCGYCGSQQVVASVKQRSGVREYFLVCNGARVGITKCNCIRYPLAELETAFMMQVSAIDVTKYLKVENTGMVEKLTEMKMSLEVEIKNMDLMIENLRIAIKMKPLLSLIEDLERTETELEEKKQSLIQLDKQIIVARNSENPVQSRLAAMLKLFRSIKHSESPLEVRAIRESLYEQIRTITDKLILYPSGPALSKDRKDKEDRFARVLFKSGTEIEI